MEGEVSGMTGADFYIGYVTHRRLRGPAHRLRYRLAYVLVDLDQMTAPQNDRPSQRSAFLGLGRGGLMSVLAKDHGDGRSADLAAWARRFLKQRGIEQDCARIELLTLPRMFGYVFNPISVYFFYNEYGALHHILYEVNNTFGGRKFYLAPANEGRGRQRYHCAKTFYVSPFFDVDGQYRFCLRPPRETVQLAIDYADSGGAPALEARLVGKRQPATSWQCLKILFSFPFMTAGVIAAIHWEALKLFVKGAKFKPPPTCEAEAGDHALRRVAAKKRKITPTEEAIHGRI